MRTFLVKAIDNAIVYVHGADQPGDGEWDEQLEIFESIGDRTAVKVLVFTTGATLSPRQRSKLIAAFDGSNPRIAMLTSSMLSRAMATAIGWFNPNMKAFGLDDLEPALDHLRASGDERSRITETLAQLKKEFFGAR